MQKKKICRLWLFLLFLVMMFSWPLHQKMASFWYEKKRVFVEPEIKRVTVFDQGRQFQVVAKAQTVGQLLEEEKIITTENDLVWPEKETPLVLGSSIKIERSFSYSIKVDGKEIKGNTRERTVKETLREAGVKLSPLDQVSPSQENLIKEESEIIVTRIEKKNIKEKEEIEYEKITKEDDDMKWGRSELGQKGEKGVKEVEYEVTYKNGELVSKIKIDSEILKEPVPEITIKGTKIVVGEVQKGLASWYDHTGKLACASVRFPRGTWLRITNKENGKQVIVQVNDYGPDPGTGKVIDLDLRAFKEIADPWRGVTKVKIEEIL